MSNYRFCQKRIARMVRVNIVLQLLINTQSNEKNNFHHCYKMYIVLFLRQVISTQCHHFRTSKIPQNQSYTEQMTLNKVRKTK